MAKHIYVSSIVAGGATGDQSYATQQTGSMADLETNNPGTVYDTLEDAVLGAVPTDGDFVYVANDHAASYSLSANLLLGGVVGGAGITYISVDTTAIDEYLAGASEYNTTTVEFSVIGGVCMKGIDIRGSDDSLILGQVGAVLLFQDAKITNDGGNSDQCLRLSIDGLTAQLNNVELVSSSAISEFLVLSSGNKLIWNGGSVSGTMPPVLFFTLGGVGGANAIITGVDFSLFSGAFYPVQTAGVPDCVFVKMQSCQLHASVTLPTSSAGTPTNQQRFEMYNCDDATGLALHRFYISTGAGMVRNNDGTYVDADTPWYEVSDKSSMEISTSAICSNANPLWFELPTQYIDLGDTASDKVSLDILIDTTAITTLTDADFNVFLIYPDKTTIVKPRQINNSIAIPGNGTELNTIGALVDADWTKSIADGDAKQYRIDLDTAGQAGEAFPVIVRVEVYKPNIAWGDLFIGSELVVGT